MCGIVGYSGSFKKDIIKHCLDSIAHRGPDDSGSYFDESSMIGLGHRRLSILDLSPMGHQPMLNADQNIALVFNGEIYNFQDLKKDLESKGYKFRGHSDTEVLLNLYIDQGEAMLSKINGIFAFALWDKRKETLLLARDGLGVKPLYYANSKYGFAFASEIKALLPLLPERAELDLESIHRYLGFLWCPGDGTPIKSVRKLQPGEAMIVKGGSISKRWEWYKLPSYNSQEVRAFNDNWIDGTASYLKQAVHRQMVSDVPLGAFLSGGLDSSSVVAFASEINPEIRCFTIEIKDGQEIGDTDDLPYAHRAAEHLGVPLDVVQINSQRMADDLEQMVVHLDEPIADPAPLNVLYISSLARQNGIKVLLSGAGGDDLFTGYRRHHALSLEKWWRWLPKKMRTRIDTTFSSLDKRNALFRRLAKLFNGADLDGNASIANYFLWARENDLLDLYTNDARDQLKDVNVKEPLIDFLAVAPEGLSKIDKMLLLEKRFFLGDHNLIYTDKMSMAAGVEARVPFLDIDLVEFAARIPPSYKHRGGIGKWVMKKAMEPYLPKDLIYRPKTGFGAPIRRWMRQDLREILGDMLSEDSLKRRGIFDPNAVQKMILANDSGKLDASYTLLSLLCFEIWCRNFID